MNLIKKIYFYKIVKPLKITFSTSLGKKDVIKSVIIKVYLSDGTYGLGEVPTSFVLKNETLDVIQQILVEVSSQFVNTPIEKYQEKIVLLRKKYSQTPMTISGLEVALFRAYLNLKNLSEYVFWKNLKNSLCQVELFELSKILDLFSFTGLSAGTEIKSTKLETDITIPFLTDFDLLKKWISYTIKKGFKIFKLKVSGNFDQDKKLLCFVYTVLRSTLQNFKIRLDGNQGYNKKTFIQMLNFIEKKDYKIQIFEQPLPKKDYSGLKYIKKCSHIPIILDETVFNSDDMNNVVDKNLADGVNIKTAKSGILESLKIMQIAKKNNLKLMIGCMMETMVGMSVGLNFAAGTSNFDFIDLDCVHFLHQKNLYENIKISTPFFVIKNL